MEINGCLNKMISDIKYNGDINIIDSLEKIIKYNKEFNFTLCK